MSLNTLEMSRNHAREGLNTGTDNLFLPRVDRSSFARNFAVLAEQRAFGGDGVVLDTQVMDGHKISYNGRLSPDEKHAERHHFGMNYYNASETEDGGTVALRLQDEEHRHIHDQALRALREHGVRVINPFAKEDKWLGGVLAHTIGRLGVDHVHPCHAGICDDSFRIAQKSGAQVFEQKRILGCIDYEKLKRLELLPPDYTPKGTKGMTMYTAMLGLEANGLLQGPVATMDTDISNPGPANGYGGPDDYIPLDYLALPFTDPNLDPTEISAVFTARGGDGRNNHTIKGELMRYLDDESDPYMRALAWNMVKRTWLLTGEFMMDGELIKDLPWPTDMGIEIMAALHTAGHELEHGKALVCQVANPTNKDTKDDSDEEREFGSILYPVQTALQSGTQMVKWTGRPPHLWDTEDVALYNMHFAGQRKRTVVMNNSLHGPQKMRSYTTGFVMPSIRMMRKLDVVDFDAIRRMSQGINQTNFYM